MPTAVRVATGNRGRIPINENEPKPDPRRPDKPELSDIASAEWDRIVPLIEAMGTLSADSGAALAIYCEAFADWTAARRQIAAEGLVVSSPQGTKKNPAFDVASKCTDIMLKCLREFGLTPSSRTGLSVKVNEEEVDLDSFVNKKLQLAEG